MPKVSVLMPVYNAAPYLRQSIESILAQDFDDFEFIIINDGSKDKSLEIIKSYNDSRIRLYSNESNLGVIGALNLGLNLSNSEYIIRMDADDISKKERFGIQVKFMDSHPLVVAAGCSAEVIDSHGKSLKRIWKYPETNDDIRAHLFFHSGIIHPTAILRNHIFKEHKLSFDKNYLHAEDYHLWWQLSNYGELRNISQPLLKYRRHSNQITMKYKFQQENISALIVIRSLAEKGLNLTTEEQRLFKRIHHYDFAFKEAELTLTKKMLERLYAFSIQYMKISDFSIGNNLAEKWFLTCYHSNQYKGYTIFRSSDLHQYYSLSLKEKIKFWLKPLLRI